MSRFMMTLIAAAAAAIAALAVVALPAIGAGGTTGGGSDNPDLSRLATCLAAHGLPGAPSGGMELKLWLGRKTNAEPDRVGAAMTACQGSVPQRSAPGPDIQAMIACVRSHGVDAPTDPGDFKRWIGEQQQAGLSKALEDALRACKISLAPETKAQAPAKSACGPATGKAGPPAGKAGPPADKPKRPASPSDTTGT